MEDNDELHDAQALTFFQTELQWEYWKENVPG